MRGLSKTICRPYAHSEPVYDYEEAMEDILRRRRRRRFIIAGVLALLILLVTVGVAAGIQQPTFAIQTMTVDRIDISSHIIYLNVRLSVDNPNGIRAYLLGVEGDIFNGGQQIGDFRSDETVEIPPHTNFTLDLDVAVDNAPLPLPDPYIVVEGKARLRVWIVGLTYHFEHSIPLTYDPDMTNNPPLAVIDSPRWVRRDRPAEFDGSNSYDTDGQVVGWLWDFGDGSTGEGAIVEHAYIAPGVYDITLTVVDQMGARASASDSIRVLPV